MTINEVRKVIEGFLSAVHKEKYLAENAEFTTMFDGKSYTGPAAITGMLKEVYQIAFQARAELKNLIINEGHAVLEAEFIGKHIGDYEGIPATGKHVSIPFCVVYDLRDGKIQSARIYFDLLLLLQQLKNET